MEEWQLQVLEKHYSALLDRCWWSEDGKESEALESQLEEIRNKVEAAGESSLSFDRRVRQRLVELAILKQRMGWEPSGE